MTVVGDDFGVALDNFTQVIVDFVVDSDPHAESIGNKNKKATAGGIHAVSSGFSFCSVFPDPFRNLW